VIVLDIKLDLDFTLERLYLKCSALVVHIFIIEKNKQQIKEKMEFLHNNRFFLCNSKTNIHNRFLNLSQNVYIKSFSV